MEKETNNDYQLTIISKNNQEVKFQYTDNKCNFPIIFIIHKSTNKLFLMDTNGGAWKFTENYRNGAQYIYHFVKNRKNRKLNLHKDFTDIIKNETGCKIESDLCLQT